MWKSCIGRQDMLIFWHDMNDQQTVGRLIREARKAAGLTVMQVGSMVGTAHSQISQLERGEHIVGWDVLGRVADALDLSLDILLGREKVLSAYLAKSKVVERVVMRIEPDQVSAFESLMSFWLSLPLHRRAAVQSMAELIFADEKAHAKKKAAPRPRTVRQKQKV